MTVVGIVAEYNPLHNGHFYHINAAKRLSNAEYAVCVMSSNFVQRGEAAILNKWFRTHMALKAGIDLVIELPAVYAVQSAEQFAYGAVKLLNSLNIVDYLCFGSESGHIEPIEAAAQLLEQEPEPLKYTIKRWLDNGLSYPHAMSKALQDYAQVDIALTPNNILAIEYIKALMALNSSMKPITVRRLHSSYTSTILEGSISSATAIRHAIYKYGLEHNGVKQAIPSFTYDILSHAFACGYGPVFTENIEQVIIYTLRNMPVSQLAEILDVSEGLEHRIKEAVEISGDLCDLVRHIKAKRYTQARIQRIFIHAMLGITYDMMNKLQKAGGPQYIRILGFSEKGRQLLSHIKAKVSLPILSKAADYKKILTPLGCTLFEVEIKATDLYSLAYRKAALRRTGNEFIQDIYHIY